MTSEAAARPKINRKDGPEPELLAGCLDWLGRNVAWFGPDKWNERFPPREIETQTVLELLMLCRILARGPQSEAGLRLTSAAEAIARAAMADPAFETRLREADAQFPYLVWVLALAGGQDARTDELRRLVQLLLDLYGTGVQKADWSPTHIMELRYILDSGGFRADVPGFGKIFDEDLYRDIDPLRVGENECYAITHTLLYATDLTAEQLPVTPATRDRLATLLLDLLGVQLVAGQLDLTSELLHCLAAVGQPRTLLTTLAWRRLREAQLPSGAVPGPPWDAEVAATRTDDEAEAYEFRTCYHTTLVAAMAAAAAEGHR